MDFGGGKKNERDRSSKEERRTNETDLEKRCVGGLLRRTFLFDYTVRVRIENNEGNGHPTLIREVSLRFPKELLK